MISARLLPLMIELPVRTAEGPDMTRYLVVCMLLLVGIAGVSYLLRRFLGTTLRARAAKRSLQMLDVLPLGGKQKIFVVRCYDRCFLVGQGERELRTLAELDGEAFAEREDDVVAPVASHPRGQAEITRPERADGADLVQRVQRAPEPEAEGMLEFAASLSNELGRDAARPKRPTLENGRGVIG